jgi:AraC-like DNA-binding protein
MRTVDFVDSYFDAWNDHDPKGVADHLAANGIYRDVPENARRSHDELIDSLSDFFVNHAHRYELIGEILKGRNTIAFQYRIYSLDDSDSSTEYNGAEFMTLSGDSAISITDYYDLPDHERQTNLAELASADAQQRKYAKSGLCPEQMREYKMTLEEIMYSEQLFLRSDLTLPRLAKVVDCSANHLSQVINSGFGISFFDYLNRYRVQHAITLLGNTDQQSNVILNIAFAVGFNSNSAFYAAFKKCVGQTPAQYRKIQMDKPH